MESTLLEATNLFKSVSLLNGTESTINMQELYGKSYYFYKGSLTTPPYSENVLWFVFKDVINVPSDLINQAKATIGTNARDTQVNDNEIYIFDNSSVNNIRK